MTVNIRSIQHYMYCPRQFGLLVLNRDWSENALVVMANIMHERVHSGKHELHSRGKIELSSVSLYHDELDLYGIADCIEFVKSKTGTYIEQLGDKFDVNIVEYKPRQPVSGTANETDAIQVFAQKLCADYIWNCKSTGYIYYGDTHRRVKLHLNEEYDKYYTLLQRLISEMNDILESGSIPARVKGQKCSGCSLKDVCMPQNKKYAVRSLVKEEQNI